MKSLTIGLLWHSAASDNLGVGALTVADIAIIRSAAAAVGIRPRFVVFGWRESRAPYVVGEDVEFVALRTRELVQPGGFAARARDCDIVIDIGFGDSFADIYGGSRMLKMTLAKAAVLLAGRPLVLAPQTMGPFDRRWSRMAALATIRRSRAVFTRDGLSTAFLREIGYRGPVHEATDVALRLPFDPPAPRGDGPVRVGLNVSGLLMSGGYDRGNMFGLKTDYPRLIDEVIRAVMARPDHELHLVGHVVSDEQPVEDDHRACARLAETHPGVVLAPRFGHPSEAKSYIAGLDFFAGARMHACIAAFSSGVPVVPMAYSRKFEGLFGSLGYDRTVDCKSQDNAAVLAAVMAGLDARETLAREAAAALERGMAKLAVYEDALRALLAEAGA